MFLRRDDIFGVQMEGGQDQESRGILLFLFTVSIFPILYPFLQPPISSGHGCLQLVLSGISLRLRSPVL